MNVHSAGRGRSGAVLVVFVDGVGIGEADPGVNPLAVADVRRIRELLDGRRPLAPALTPASRPAVSATRGTADSGSPRADERDPAPLGARPDRPPTATLLGLDATLGVDGIPQSGTGQAALLTGVNAAKRFGRHFGPWTPTALRPVVARESFLRRAQRAGRSVAFANAYPAELAAMAPGASGHRSRPPLPLRTGPVIAAVGAGLLTRHAAELGKGSAVASGIVNDGWREHLGHKELPEITAAEAGANLAGVAAEHDLTLYAHYATDRVGHGRDMTAAIASLERLDAFLGGVIDGLRQAAPETVLLVVSDHGNIEDVRTGHTRNPALALVVGPRGAAYTALVRRLVNLTDVAPAVLEHIGPDEGDAAARGDPSALRASG